MAAGAATRKLSILRRNSASTAVAAGGTVDSQAAPCVGWATLSIYCRFPGAGQIDIYQRLRASSTFQITDTFTYTAAGTLRTTVNLTGEQVRVLYTNNAAGTQLPELIATME